MAKFLKLIGSLLAIIILVAVIGIIALVTFVSPNRFKPVLVEQVKKYTGRELVVDGDLSWSFFPYLGLKAGHMSLSNPEGFKEKVFAEFSSATVGVKLMPLFHKRIESSGITLHGMNLNLIKAANGKTNWTFPKASTTEAGAETDATSGKGRATAAGLAISSIDISDAKVHWVDAQKNQIANIKHFEFHANNISFVHPVPITTEFDFDVNNPETSGHAVLTTDLAFNMDSEIYSLRNLNFTAEVHKNNQNYNAQLTGDVIANLQQQTLQWTNFKANVANLKASGNINVTHLTSSPLTTGHFELAPFDLKTLLKNLGMDNDQLQVAKDMDGSIDISASAKSLAVSGHVKVDNVEAAKIRMDHVDAKLHYQDGILNLAPVTANLYQGNLNAQSTVNINNAVPQIQLQGNLTNVQAGPLLNDLRGPNQKLTVTGIANVDVQVTTVGKDSDSIVRNLNGASRFNFNNGTLEGVDLGYLVDAASSLASKHEISATNNKKTNFGTLTATAIIHNGVISNNDLLLDSPRFNTKGQGTIDLVNQHIDYSLLAAVKESSVTTVKNLAGLSIPITIKGSLNAPHICLDTETLLKTIAVQQIDKHKEQIQKKIQDKIQENIKNKIPEQAGQLLQNILGH